MALLFLTHITLSTDLAIARTREEGHESTFLVRFYCCFFSLVPHPPTKACPCPGIPETQHVRTAIPTKIEMRIIVLSHRSGSIAQGQHKCFINRDQQTPRRGYNPRILACSTAKNGPNCNTDLPSVSRRPGIATVGVLLGP
jgi:hypothetical protein